MLFFPIFVFSILCSRCESCHVMEHLLEPRLCPFWLFRSICGSSKAKTSRPQRALLAPPLFKTAVLSRQLFSDGSAISSSWQHQYLACRLPPNRSTELLYAQQSFNDLVTLRLLPIPCLTCAGTFSLPSPWPMLMLRCIFSALVIRFFSFCSQFARSWCELNLRPRVFSSGLRVESRTPTGHYAPVNLRMHILRPRRTSKIYSKGNWYVQRRDSCWNETRVFFRLENGVHAIYLVACLTPHDAFGNRRC